jgi:hypothetical protein
MQELIQRITEKAGISSEQAVKAVDTVKEFVKEKFPMLAGAVDNVFAQQADNDITAPAAAAAPVTEKKEEGLLDKISDVIPGETGEKIENFVKGAADKAEDAIDAISDKISGLFNKDDKKD